MTITNKFLWIYLIHCFSKNSLYILSFLRNWSMQSYSATITYSIVASLTHNGLLTPKGYKFYNKIHKKYYFVKLRTHFSQDLLFIGCGIGSSSYDYLFTPFKHVPLGFNTLISLPVFILRVILWKVAIKCKILIFLTFVPFF